MRFHCYTVVIQSKDKSKFCLLLQDEFKQLIQFLLQWHSFLPWFTVAEHARSAPPCFCKLLQELKVVFWITNRAEPLFSLSSHEGEHDWYSKTSANKWQNVIELSTEKQMIALKEHTAIPSWCIYQSPYSHINTLSPGDNLSHLLQIKYTQIRQLLESSFANKVYPDQTAPWVIFRK